MVVDESAVVRGLLTRALEADDAISVVATVATCEAALRTLDRKDIEIIVLDFEMPELDGMTALPPLLAAKPGAQVIMTSTPTRRNAEVSLRALSMGAADCLTRPASPSEILSAAAFQRELHDKIKAVAEAGRRGRVDVPAAARPAAATRAPVPAVSGRAAANTTITLRTAPVQRPEVIAIGSSTGGPQALLQIIGELGADVTQPILITQHMPADFTALLAEHVARASGRPCHEARDGEAILPGRIYVAPGDRHMVVETGHEANVIRLTQDAPENFCRPAVDPMLRSMAPVYGARLLVVVLTGMGVDGRNGCEAVTAAGGSVIAQDEATSVVWGMPGAVATAGLCSAVLPLAEIAPYVRKLALRSAA